MSGPTGGLLLLLLLGWSAPAATATLHIGTASLKTSWRACPCPPAGSSKEGLQAWKMLAALQDGKAPPTPAAANSSFMRCSLETPLLFESEAWQVELSKMTGAIVGLRFKGGGGAGSGSSSSSNGGAMAGAGGSSRNGSSSQSPWARLLSRLWLPGRWLAAGRSSCRSGGAGSAGPAPVPKPAPVLSNASWASFNAPLALPVYSTYSEDDYDTIWDSYAWQGQDNLADWFYRDFGKPNATGGHSRRGAEVAVGAG